MLAYFAIVALNPEPIIVLTFAIVLAAILIVEMLRMWKATSLAIKSEAQVTALEDTALELMVSKVKLALQAAQKKQLVSIKSGPLVPDRETWSSDPRWVRGTCTGKLLGPARLEAVHVTLVPNIGSKPGHIAQASDVLT